AKASGKILSSDSFWSRFFSSEVCCFNLVSDIFWYLSASALTSLTRLRRRFIVRACGSPSNFLNKTFIAISTRTPSLYQILGVTKYCNSLDQLTRDPLRLYPI